MIVATGYNPDFARAARGLALARGQFDVTTLNKPVSMAGEAVKINRHEFQRNQGEESN